MWVKTSSCLTYQEAVTLVEKFMIDSKIREYCTEICKGSCCSECYMSEDACHLHEGRRLICSTYLCYTLKRKFSEETQNTLTYVHGYVNKQYSNYQKLVCVSGNVYFNSPDKTFLEVARFGDMLEGGIKSIEIKSIRAIMKELIKNKKKLR
jgi:hypothetical protein